MKKIAILFFVLFSIQIYGQIPSYVPSNGLIGWWPFDGNANDESGNGNNGVVNGATLTNDRLGAGNKAYQFNGVSDYIEVADASSLDFSSGSQTVSFWLKISSFPSPVNEEAIFEKMDQNLPIDPSGNSAQGFQIHFDSNANISYRIKSGSASGWSLLTIPSNMIMLNQFFHVVFTNDNDSLRSFLNGIKVSTAKVSSGTTIGLNSNPLLMGKELWTSLGANMDYFNGNLDDVGIWNRALSQQEISNLYTSSLQSTCSTSQLPSGLSSGLVAWYPFCGNANDESGNGNNGNVNGAQLTTDRWGNSNSAYDFDGNDTISVLHSTSLEFSTNAISVSYWLNPHSYPVGATNNQILISKQSGSGVTQNGFNIYQLENSSHGLYVGANSIGGPTINTPPLNEWHHVVFVYDNGNCFGYFDGVLSHTSTTTSLLGSNTESLLIGAPNWVFMNSFNYDGILDDIGFWDRALTQQEVTSLYNVGICYQTVTVTDTLIINANLTGFNPIAYQNTIKVYPNPTNDQITIDCGANFGTMSGYTIRIDNLLSQTVYTTTITQQNFIVDLNTWTGNGIYLIYLINSQGTPIDVRKIVIQ